MSVTVTQLSNVDQSVCLRAFLPLYAHPSLYFHQSFTPLTLRLLDPSVILSANQSVPGGRACVRKFIIVGGGNVWWGLLRIFSTQTSSPFRPLATPYPSPFVTPCPSLLSQPHSATCNSASLYFTRNPTPLPPFVTPHSSLHS